MMLRGIVLVLCMFVSFTYAQADKTKSQPAPQPAAPAPAPVKEKAAVQGSTKVLAGSITSIDPEKKIVSVKVKSGTYPVSVEEKTTILAGGQPATFADIKKGDKVHIEYQKASNGQRVAVRVNAPAPRPAARTAAQAAPKEPTAAAPKTQPATPAKPDAKTAVVPMIKGDTAAAAKPAAKTVEPAPVKK